MHAAWVAMPRWTEQRPCVIETRGTSQNIPIAVCHCAFTRPRYISLAIAVCPAKTLNEGCGTHEKWTTCKNNPLIQPSSPEPPSSRCKCQEGEEHLMEPCDCSENPFLRCLRCSEAFDELDWAGRPRSGGTLAGLFSKTFVVSSLVLGFRVIIRRSTNGSSPLGTMSPLAVPPGL